MYLEKIDKPQDLKCLDYSDMAVLAQEMRDAMIRKGSVCGANLASNLGVVELTIALHYVFDAPADKIIFDTSHQTYCHKMLTGRKAAFLNPENYKDVSNFSNPDESEYDLFHIGHTSTSISLACGMAKARDLRGGKENVIAVIGDASLDGGEAFEALNYAAELNSGLIVVVNDNNMSIPENYGALSKQLTELRESNGVVENNFFKALGLQYYYVGDGHDIKSIVDVLKRVKDTDCPVVVHVSTVKGKGLLPAEQDPESWHWVHAFDIKTGQKLTSVPKENYGAIACEYLMNRMKADPDLAVVAASMPQCIGFYAENRKIAGKQLVDVGIAEQNAVSLAAGMVENGVNPVFACQSSFIQRAYDQIEQEVAIGRCPITIIITYGSVFAHNTDTHAGLYDISLLGNIPNLIYLAPTNKQEYLAMLEWSIDQDQAPVVIRVPWTGVHHTSEPVDSHYDTVRYKVEKQGTRVAFLALGGFYQLGEQAAQLLEERTGTAPTVINPRFITGTDDELLNGLRETHDLVVTLEDGILSGGFGARIAQFYAKTSMKVLNCGFSTDIPNRFVASELMEQNRLTPEQIVEDILRILPMN